MRKKIILGVLLFIVIVTISTVTWNDRIPYQEKKFYARMLQRMDSLEKNFPDFSDKDEPIAIGWSKINITPKEEAPLAGYGARNPKWLTGIHDSVYINTIVFKKDKIEKAILSADLLIIPPEVKIALAEKLNEIGWDINNVYLTATHTHSSFGGWHPGVVGELFAGEFDPQVVAKLAEQMTNGIKEAYENASPGKLGFAEIFIPYLIKNRLVGKRGIIDTSLKSLFLSNTEGEGIQGFFSAHATCFDHNFSELSADYPGYFKSHLQKDTTFDFAGFSAGAVGSMGPGKENFKGLEKASEIGSSLANQIQLLKLIGIPRSNEILMRSIKIKLELRDPSARITKNIGIKPWVFELIYGQYPAEIAIMQLNDILLIGLPCDFSGELAVPLYEFAQKKGLNLIITSFNGGYIGYVLNDEWYDMDSYETMTMSWYGKDNGAYFTEILTRIIELSASKS